MDESNYREFVDDFVRYKLRTRTVTDKGGNKTQETYTVAVPISDLNDKFMKILKTPSPEP